MATLKYKEGGVVKELILPASGIKLLDIENNFQSKNLEEVLKEIGETDNVYLGEIDPNKEGIWFDSSDQLNTSDDNTVVERIKDYINTENTYEADVTTSNELSVINEDLQKQIKITSVQGRTFVNLMGYYYSNCDVATAWLGYQSTLALDGANVAFGSGSIKVTSSATSGQCLIYRQNFYQQVLQPNSYYCVSAYVKNGTLPNPIIVQNGGSNVGVTIGRSVGSSDTTKFKRIFALISTGATINCDIDFGGATTATGQYFYIDGIQVEQITQAQYNDVNFVPSPYISNNDMSVGETSIKIKTRGKNLMNLAQGSHNAYGLPITSFLRATHKDGAIKVKPNTTYTVSLDKPLFYVYHEYDENRTQIDTNTWSASSGTTFSFTTGANTRYTSVVFKIDDVTPIYADYKIQVEEGSVATAYEPYQETYISLDTPLRSLPDGTKDEIKDGKLIRRVGKFTLDGTLPWVYYATTTGMKQVIIPNTIGLTPANMASALGLKYNNKVMPFGGGWISSDLIGCDLNYIYVNIPQAESGWGDSYNPTQDEIKAYFNGWIMTTQESWNTSPVAYNGTGTKGWLMRFTGVNTRAVSPTLGEYVLSSGNATCPTYLVGTFNPYRMYYKLPVQQIEDSNYQNLIVFKNCNLLSECQSQDFMRPSYTYKIVDTLKTNINELEKGLSDTTRMLQKSKYDIEQISNPNLLINGDFQVWQRGTSFSATTGFAGYLADRWHEWSYTVGMTATVSKGSNCLIWGTIGNNGLRQCIETNVNDKELTFSVRIKGKLNDSISLSVLDSVSPTNNVRQVSGSSFVCTGGIDTFVINVPKTNYSKFCTVCITTNSTSTFYVYSAKLEVGNKATPFSPRSYAEELELCMRYYEKYDGNLLGLLSPTNGSLVGFPFKVKKRVVPTVTFKAAGGGGIFTAWAGNSGAGSTTQGRVGATIDGVDYVDSMSQTDILKGNIYYTVWVADAEIL